MNDADTDRAVAAFREYFPDKGLFENEVYPGHPPRCWPTCTPAAASWCWPPAKPEEYARRIMEHFDLAQYFTAICGATLDETRTDKAEVIAYALDTIGLTNKTGVVMVGDREHDVIAAEEKRPALHRRPLRLRHPRRTPLCRCCRNRDTVQDLHKLLLG